MPLKTEEIRKSLCCAVEMDSVLFPGDTSSITTGGKILWRNKNRANNYYYATSQPRRTTWGKHDLLRFQLQPSLKRRLYKSIEEEGSTYQECNRKYVVKAASGPSFESDPPTSDLKTFFDPVKKIVDTFLLFVTPYAIIGAVLAIISTSFLVVEKLSDISPLFFTGLLQAVICSLLMTIYVCGLNQLCDVEIDKINKPHLPLASGKLSVRTGVIIVVSCLMLSFWLAWIVGSWPLIWANVSLLVVWSTYSIDVPLLRWKRYPVLAAMCTLLSLAFTSPIAYFFHMQTFVFKRPAIFPRPLMFSVVIMSFFSLVVTLFKDIPDIEGDQAFGIQSFAARLGKKRVFWICISILEMGYGVAILVGVKNHFLWSKIITVLGHAVLALALLYRARSVDLTSKASIMSFYMFIWQLMYAEYLLIPLGR